MWVALSHGMDELDSRVHVFLLPHCRHSVTSLLLILFPRFSHHKELHHSKLFSFLSCLCQIFLCSNKKINSTEEACSSGHDIHRRYKPKSWNLSFLCSGTITSLPDDLITDFKRYLTQLIYNSRSFVSMRTLLLLVLVCPWYHLQTGSEDTGFVSSMMCRFQAVTGHSADNVLTIKVHGLWFGSQEHTLKQNKTKTEWIK